MPAPNWSFLAHIIPTGDEWAYSSPTETAWIKLQHFGQFPYPNRAVGLLAEAEFTSAGEVLRTEARMVYHSTDSQILYLPPPLILTKSQRRIAVRRLARSTSYTPWELSIYSSDMPPLYGEANNVVRDLPIADSIPTTFSAVVYAAATPAASYQCLAANALRRKFSVTNTGTATVYGDLDAPSSATSRSFVVPPGNTYVYDDEYAGAVFIWSTVAAAQSCQIRELI
jgi:hypothetical protein